MQVWYEKIAILEQYPGSVSITPGPSRVISISTFRFFSKFKLVNVAMVVSSQV